MSWLRGIVSKDSLEQGLALREDEGWTIGQLVKKFGGSEGFWRYQMVIAGIEPSEIQREGRVFTPEMDQEILCLSLAGVDVRDIAKKFGKSRSSVRYRLLIVEMRRDAA